MVISSPDISTLDFDVLFNLSLAAPVIVVTSKCVGNNLAGCHFIFTVSAPSGAVIHEGVFTSADVNGAWVSYQIPEALPLVMRELEWGGGGYKVVCSVKDSFGNVFGPATKTKALCKPGKQGINGDMSLQVETLCSRARLKVTDTTNYVYMTTSGIRTSSALKLIYPNVNSTTVTAPFVRNDFYSNMFIPLFRDGEGYQLLAEAVKDFHFIDGVTVRLKYIIRHVFDVNCTVDLCGLVKCLFNYTNLLQQSGCSNEQREKLLIANTHLSAIIIAKLQPTCNINIPNEIQKIESILGVNCNCGCGTQGLNNIIDCCADITSCDAGDPSTIECVPFEVVPHSTSLAVSFLAVPAGTTYKVQLYADINGTTLLQLYTVNAGGTGYTFTGLQASTNYWVRIEVTIAGVTKKDCPLQQATTTA